MQMSRLNKILDNLQEKESLGAIRPLAGAVNSFLFGSGKVTSSAPHIVDSMDTRRYMTMIFLALVPLALAAIYFYGWRALVMILVSYIFGGLTEVLFAVFRNKKFQAESFLVTGLLFPLLLPPTLPLWIVAVGSVFGVFFGKEIFGGTGRNIFHPAIVGRVFITISFPSFMTNIWQQPLLGGLGGFLSYQADVITSATPLISFRAGEAIDYSYYDLLFGGASGSMGETFRIGIILAGIFLIILKISNWRIPAAYLGSVVLLSGIGHYYLPDQVAPPLFQLLTGGLLFAAFFIATDSVTSPFTRPGKWVFGVLLGLLTVLFRSFSGSVEGVMYSILLMNALTPLIDTVALKVKRQPERTQPTGKEKVA